MTQHPTAKLTQEQVCYIRRGLKYGEATYLSALWGVTEMVISNIKRGKSYRGVVCPESKGVDL